MSKHRPETTKRLLKLTVLDLLRTEEEDDAGDDGDTGEDGENDNRESPLAFLQQQQNHLFDALLDNRPMHR